PKWYDNPSTSRSCRFESGPGHHRIPVPSRSPPHPRRPRRHRVFAEARAGPRTPASPPYVIMAARHPGAPPPVPMFHRRTAWFAFIAIAVLGIVLARTWSPAWWLAVAGFGPLALVRLDVVLLTLCTSRDLFPVA